MTKPVANEDEKFTPSINLVKFILPNELSFKEYVKKNLDGIHSIYANLEVKSQENFTIEGREAFKIVCLVQAGNLNLGMVSTYVLNKNEVYIITCIAKGEDKEFVKLFFSC